MFFPYITIALAKKSKPKISICMTAITIPWLTAEDPFPPVNQALDQGLLAAGADLSVPRLLDAYSKGLFPWFNEGEPILWWSPNPRAVLQCNQFKLSKSLAKKCRQIARNELDTNHNESTIKITTNTAFLQVISQCSATRQKQEGTWISNEIIEAYYELHRYQHAHSIEVWQGKQLVGGLYGVQLGQFFFGESMFSLINDASKIALYYLTIYLQNHLTIQYIDCQQTTSHLSSLGAKTIDRTHFIQLLKQYTPLQTPVWGSGQLNANGILLPC